MSDKTKTKAELLEMLAEAVRNTQPQPARNTQPEPVRDAQPEPVRDAQPEPKRKTQPGKARPAPNRTAKIKGVRASASRRQRRR